MGVYSEAYLRDELVGNGFIVFKLELSCHQCTLKKETQWQLSQLSLNKGTDCLVAKLENLGTLLFPLLVLHRTDKMRKFVWVGRPLEFHDSNCSSAITYLVTQGPVLESQLVRLEHQWR